MILSKIFHRKRSELQCDMLGMTFMSPVGLYVKDKETGIKYAKLQLNTAYSYVIVNCKELSQTVDILRRLPRQYNIIAHLDVKQEYLYYGKSKSMEAAFGILYDFVDAFLISSIDSMSSDVDALINLRMYNDEYRPILLDVPSNLLYADLDEILDYCLLSNVDGCLISDPRLLKYANDRCGSYLCLIAGGVDSESSLKEAKKNGADLICTDSSRHSTLGLIFLGRKLLRLLHKLA